MNRQRLPTNLSLPTKQHAHKQPIFAKAFSASYNGCMFAAKEKTFSPSSRSTFTWSPRGTYVQAAATLDRQPSMMNDVYPVVSRFTQNDFRARKSEKSPIGSTVKSRSKAPWQNQYSAEKTLGENVVHLRRSHRANDMSQYRAYFVPGSVDPWGLQQEIHDEGGSVWYSWVDPTDGPQKVLNLNATVTADTSDCGPVLAETIDVLHFGTGCPVGKVMVIPTDECITYEELRRRREDCVKEDKECAGNVTAKISLKAVRANLPPSQHPVGNFDMGTSWELVGSTSSTLSLTPGPPRTLTATVSGISIPCTGGTLSGKVDVKHKTKGFTSATIRYTLEVGECGKVKSKRISVISPNHTLTLIE